MCSRCSTTAGSANTGSARRRRTRSTANSAPTWPASASVWSSRVITCSTISPWPRTSTCRSHTRIFPRKSARRWWPTFSTASKSSPRKICIPSQLSGGQQQLVGIARAVVHAPALLLADEPTGNLHSTQAREIMELFCELNRAGTTIVQVTHSEENARYSKRIVELRDGWLTRDEAICSRNHGGRRTVNLRLHATMILICGALCPWLVASSLACRANLRIAAEPAQAQTAPANSAGDAAGAGSSSARGEQRPRRRRLRWRNRCSKSSNRRLPRQQPFYVRCRTRITRFRLISRAMRPRWTSTTRRGWRTSSATESCIFRCATRLLLPSRTTSIWPTSAITSPLRRPTSSAPKRAALPTASTPASSKSTQGGFRRLHRRRRLERVGFCCRRGRHRHFDARRRNHGSLLRSLPHFQGLRRSHRHPGGQRVPDRRADPQDKHHSGPGELLASPSRSAPTF